MIYRRDIDWVYVLYYADGTWGSYPDTYVDGQPSQLNEYTPPPGLQQPILGFDRVWENYPEVRNKIGWALQGEVGLIGGSFREYQGGTAFWLNHTGYLTKYYILFHDATWQER